jgi:hypothetical protein
VQNGILIGAIANNGRDHGQGQGTQYGAVGIDQAGVASAEYFLSLNQVPWSNEYNADVGAAYFTYDQFTVGWTRTSNGAVSRIIGSDDVVLGQNFNTVSEGVYELNLDGENTLEDGILLVVSGRNTANYAVSRPQDDGTGYLIGARTAGAQSGDYTNDQVGFVYLKEGETDLTFGRVMGDGTSTAGQGGYHIEKLGVGTFRLTIDGMTPADGTLVLSSEGFDLYNEDNVVSYQADGDGWIIQTRDIFQMELQDAGESAYVSLTGNHLKPAEIPDAAYSLTFAENLQIWQDATIETPFIMINGAFFHGDEGQDVIAYDMLRSDATVRLVDGIARVTADGGLDLADGMESLLFTDGRLELTGSGDGHLIDRLYQGALGRNAESFGLSYWDGRTQEPGGMLAIARAMLDSQESMDHAPASDAAFIDSLYGSILGRAPEGDEQAQWLDLLAEGGDRAQILLGIASSTEAVAQASGGILAVADFSQVQVAGAYQMLLGRDADAAGLSYWSARVDAGGADAMVHGMTTSQEFNAHYGAGALSDAAFIGALYQSAFGREGDVAGSVYWGGVLALGTMTRGDIAQSLYESQEGHGVLESIAAQGFILS